MLNAKYTNKFKKDYKLIQKCGYNIEKLKTVVAMLCSEETLPEKYKDHQLGGDYSGYRECHIEPDWLLVYKIENQDLLLVLSRTGTHSDLF